MKNIGNFLKIYKFLQNQYNKAILCFNWKTKKLPVSKKSLKYCLCNIVGKSAFSGIFWWVLQWIWCMNYDLLYCIDIYALKLSEIFFSLMSLRKAFVLLLKCVKRKPLIHFKESLASDIMFAICWWEINDK